MKALCFAVVKQGGGRTESLVLTDRPVVPWCPPTSPASAPASLPPSPSPPPPSSFLSCARALSLVRSLYVLCACVSLCFCLSVAVSLSRRLSRLRASAIPQWPCAHEYNARHAAPQQRLGPKIAMKTHAVKSRNMRKFADQAWHLVSVLLRPGLPHPPHPPCASRSESAAVMQHCCTAAVRVWIWAVPCTALSTPSGLAVRSAGRGGVVGIPAHQSPTKPGRMPGMKEPNEYDRTRHGLLGSCAYADTHADTCARCW